MFFPRSVGSQRCSGSRDASAARPQRWRRPIAWGVRGALAASIVGALIVGCDGFFYYPSRHVWYSPAQFGLRHEDVYFRTSDGLTLHGWWLPAQTPPGSRSGGAGTPPGAARGTVLHFHGNAANVTNHVVLVEWLPRRGYNVLLFDYRGYGRSEGRVSRTGTIRDGHAALDYVLTRADVDARRIFAYGQSLGGAVAVVVAADRPEFAAVAVESPFSSYRRIAAMHLRRLTLLDAPARGLAAALISTGHEPIDAVARISPRPLLVIAAQLDDICHPDMARELFDAAGEPKEFHLSPGAVHLGVFEAEGADLERRICGFFERA